MDIVRTAVDEFWTGHGGADAVARSLVVPGYAPQKAMKGVRVRAATANTIVIHVGRAGVTVDNGYPLPAGEELEVQVEDIAKVHVIATPAGNSQQVVTIAGDIAGETFTLTLDGHTSGPIAVGAAAADVEDALEVLPGVGVGNVSVSGDAGGPFTIEFIGALAKQDLSLLVGSDGGINEKQTVAVAGGAAGDKMVLTYSGQPTGELAYDATSAQVAAALKGLNNIGDNDVAVTDGDPAGWVVEFKGALAKTDVPALTGVCGKNEKQTIEITGGAAGDELTLIFGGVSSLVPFEYEVPAAGVQTALDSIPALAGTTLVTGDVPGGPWVVEFQGALAKTDVPPLTGICGKNEKQTVVVTGGAAGDKLILTYDGQPTGELAYDATSAEIAAALKGLNNIGDSDVAVTDGDPAGWVVEFQGELAKTDVPPLTGVCGKNEKQTIGLDDGISDGTFTLTYVDQTTDPIAYNASSQDVATALKALSNIGDNDVEVTGGPGPTADWVVEFKGALAHMDIVALVGDGANLTGDVKTVTVTETIKGNAATVGITETVKGNLATVNVTETVKGNLATVNVTETQKGDAGFTVTVTKTDASAGSNFSWIAC